MSERKTHLMSIYFINNKDQYKTFEEAKKVANSLRSKLEYLRRTKEDYFINAFIGISNLNIRYGTLKYADNKKAGRNRLVIVPKRKCKQVKDKCFEPWHLHILIEANPAETIGEEIVDYFNKKFNKKIAQKKKISSGFFNYAIKQCRYTRFVVEDRETKLVRYNFKHFYEDICQPDTKARKRQRIINLKLLEERSCVNRLAKLGNEGVLSSQF